MAIVEERRLAACSPRPHALNPAAPKPELEREPVRLLLIRHGQTTSNVLHLLDTAEPGAALTHLGMQQADGLVGALSDESIDVLMASTLLRAQQTAIPPALARALPLGIRDGIREIGAGELEMRSFTGTATSLRTGELLCDVRSSPRALFTTVWPMSSAVIQYGSGDHFLCHCS